MNAFILRSPNNRLRVRFTQLNAQLVVIETKGNSPQRVGRNYMRWTDGLNALRAVDTAYARTIYRSLLAAGLRSAKTGGAS